MQPVIAVLATWFDFSPASMISSCIKFLTTRAGMSLLNNVVEAKFSFPFFYLLKVKSSTTAKYSASSHLLSGIFSQEFCVFCYVCFGWSVLQKVSIMHNVGVEFWSESTDVI